MATVNQEIQALDPELALTLLASIEEFLGLALWPRRMGAGLLAAFALLALLLAAIGIYGVISYASSQRTHEIGIRMAMGAPRANILRMVLRQGMGVTVLGIGVGMLGALAITRVLSGLLFGVSPSDPVTFVVVGVLLGGVALVATYVPARRATRTDPLAALRTE
jgi:ABC-type antimicrobial peptide transport system permease subunit